MNQLVMAAVAKVIRGELRNDSEKRWMRVQRK